MPIRYKLTLLGVHMQISNFMKLFDYHIIVTIVMVMVAWKWGDWKNWKQYYPTILFYIVFDILYSVLFYNYPLWELESPLLKTTFSDILLTMVFAPAAILLYIPYFPIGILKQVIYIFLWVFILVFSEIISYCLGFISYHNGWNICWTALFDSIMLPLMILHYKKPLMAWFVSIILLIIALIYFKVPFSAIK